MTFAGIDGDSIVYRAGFAAQRDRHTIVDKQSGDAMLETTDKREASAFLRENGHDKYEIISVTEQDPLNFALSNTKSMLEKILNTLEAEEYEIFLSDDAKPTFRDELATILPYKGNRWSNERRAKERMEGRWIEYLDATEHRKEPVGRPIYYGEIRSYLFKHYAATLITGEEADDALGYTQMEDLKNNVIVSNDKDLDQIPGRHFDYTTGMQYDVTKHEADYAFFHQALAGDLQTDNIRGIPGIGEVKAAKILDGCFGSIKKLELAAYAAYEKAGIPEQFLENARLVRIRRKRNEMWSPRYVKC